MTTTTTARKKAPAKKRMSKKTSNPTETIASHLSSGQDHIVSIAALRVLLSKDGEGWFAQGLEVDYAAAGSSVNEVKKNFEEGLKRTIRAHLQLHGSIEKLLVVAPREAWLEFYQAQAKAECIRQAFTTVQFHHIDNTASNKIATFPYQGLAFIEPITRAAA